MADPLLNTLESIVTNATPLVIAAIGETITERAGIDLEQHFSIFTELAGLSGTRKARLRALVTRRIGLPMEACSAIKAAARLTIPGLIIHDHTDIVVPHENAVELAAQWRGSTLIETWGLGHRMGLKDAGVIKEIITFLKEDEALLAT